MIACTIPLRTGRGLNDRHGCFHARAREAKEQRRTVAWFLRAEKMVRPVLPCVVTLTRRGPSNGLGDDNLVGALKACRDQVAAWLGVDDRRRDVVRYRYAQERSKTWSVRVEFAPMAPEQAGLLAEAGA